ncbi:hypothetical protein MASR1M45_15930 [Candidatus Kapaibacterium sp.]
MKNVFLIAILTIFSVSTLHSQWLEKEGYWELSEKIPDLRDLKIIPEENLIITVSKDNTIRHIEYDSGKILKSGKPEGLTDTNNYAKISSDGKTTVLARYVKNEKYSTQKRITINDLEIRIIRNSDNYLIVNQQYDANTVLGLYSYNYYEIMGLEQYSYSVCFSDYFEKDSSLFYGLNYELRWTGRATTGGEPSYSVRSGYQKNCKFVDGKLLQTNQYNANWTNEYIPLDDQQNNYILVGSNYFSKGNAHGSDIKKDNFVATKNRLLNNFNFLAKYSYSYYSSSDSFGDYGKTESGAIVPIYQLFNSKNPNIFFYRIAGKLIELDIEAKKIVNTFQNPLFGKVINMSNDSKFIHTIESKDYVIYSFPYYKEIYRCGIDTVFALPRAYLDESNGAVLIPNSAKSLILIKPDAMSNVAKFGFDWSKDTIHTGEKVNFRALTNVDGCQFDWQFIPGINTNSTSPNISYSYSKPGIYNVKLTITEPNGKIHYFNKDSIITVLETVKADFEISKLNDELPLKVQFNDKSTGNNTSWIWDFGDGEFSYEQNPIHEYKFKGDFSPKQIVSDGIDKDTIIKYEVITYHIGDFLENNAIKELKLKTGISELQRAFFVNGGINISWTYQYDTDRYFNGYRNYFSVVVSYTYDFKLNNNKIDSVILTPRDIYYSNYFNTKSIRMINQNTLIATFSKPDIEIITYNFSTKRMKTINELIFKYSVDIMASLDSSVYWICNMPDNASVIKTDSDFKILSKLPIPPNGKQYLADTINYGLNLLIREQDNSYSYFSISPENTIISEKTFTLDTNITLTNIKSVHNNLVLLHGFYNDKVNKTTYAYFAKYHPLDNSLEDTILYSRKDIRKIERVNNSTYAAIGQSRGRQGYLLLDTNLYQIKDIRVENLTGEIKDLILHNNKVYLFTEKVVSNQTMALGANESYQTTASVLSLPDEIIANVEDSPKIISDKLTHSAFPNPSSGLVNLRVITSETANFSIKLYDIYGNEIIKIHEGSLPAQTEKTFSFPTSQLPIGSYYYVISGDGIIERGKVLVVR